jgi:hypothetical protein
MKFLIALTVFVSLSAGAQSLSGIKCNFSDVTYLNQFSLEVNSLEVKEGKFHNVEFDFLLRKAGRDSRIERFALTRDGSFKVYEAGTLYTKAVYHIASTVKGAELEHISLLVGPNSFHNSKIRFLDGMTYFGTCHAL